MEEIEELKTKVIELWKKVFLMRMANGVCRNSPQKEEALKLMKKLFEKGEKKWVLMKVVEIRETLADIDYSEGSFEEAIFQLRKTIATLKKVGGLEGFEELVDIKNKLKMISEEEKARAKILAG